MPELMIENVGSPDKAIIVLIPQNTYVPQKAPIPPLTDDTNEEINDDIYEDDDIHQDDTNFYDIVYDDNIIKKEMDKYKYTILSTNIRSLKKHINHLRNLNKRIETEFISLVEVFCPLIKYVKINGYHDPLVKLRSRRKGGGCALYIKNTYSYKAVEEINKFEFEIIEILAAEIDLGNKKVTIVTVYRHPKANVPMSFRDLDR